MRKKTIAVFLTLTVVLSGISAGEKREISLAEESKYEISIDSKPSVGNTVALLDGDILQFASEYVKYSSEDYLPKDYSTTKIRKDDFAPTSATLTWQNREDALYYTVKLSTKTDMSDALSFVTFEPTLDLKDLFMGTKYYYQIVAKYEDKIVKSCIFDFTTAYLPRTISIEGVSNTRDIGGYYTADKKYRVKQGMIYRGALMEDITEEGKAAALYTYGIKTDLDLRGNFSTSPLGSQVQFINMSAPYYVSEDRGIDSTKDSSVGTWKGTYRDALVKEIKTFADPDNYPVYIHCSLGRDRTGTLAFLINALLGVGEEELYMDYELSWFSQAGCKDGAKPSNHVANAFTQLYNYVLAYGNSGSTLAKRTEGFLLDIGITQAEIDSIRSIMLEEVAV